jgi:hypothetical protein
MKLLFASLAVLFSICMCQDTGRIISLKVNLAGGPVADFLGESQVLDLSDDDYSMQTSSVGIQNTDQPDVFRTQRFARKQDLALRLPVPDGVYTVTLLFAETYPAACRPGGRVFDISIGNPVSGLTKVVESFDVFANAGCQSAYGKRLENIASKDGILIHLGHKVQHPSIAGFMVEGTPVSKPDGSEYNAIGQAGVAEVQTAAANGAAVPATAPGDVMPPVQVANWAAPENLAGNTYLGSGNNGATGQAGTGTQIGQIPGGALRVSAPGFGGISSTQQQQLGMVSAADGGKIGRRRRLLGSSHGSNRAEWLRRNKQVNRSSHRARHH